MEVVEFVAEFYSERRSREMKIRRIIRVGISERNPDNFETWRGKKFSEAKNRVVIYFRNAGRAIFANALQRRGNLEQGFRTRGFETRKSGTEE